MTTAERKKINKLVDDIVGKLAEVSRIVDAEGERQRASRSSRPLSEAFKRGRDAAHERRRAAQVAELRERLAKLEGGR